MYFVPPESKINWIVTMHTAVQDKSVILLEERGKEEMEFEKHT